MRRGEVPPRYEICKDCGRRWNVSAGLEIPFGDYLCPWCTAKYRQVQREAAQESWSEERQEAGNENNH